MKKTSCYFSTNIGDILSCCTDGEFDKNGFPENECKDFPCKKYKELIEVIDNAERKHNAKSINPE